MGTQASRSTDHGGLQIDRGDGPVVAPFANDAKNSIAHRRATDLGIAHARAAERLSC
jgi:hypothetical protein